MRFVRFSLALAALSLVAAGCGGSANAGSGSNTSEQNPDDAMVAFTNCMREHGVDVEAEADDQGRMRVSIGGPQDASESDGGGPKRMEPDPETEAAMRACEDKLPKMGQDLTPEERAELEDAMLEFAGCMREQGIDMPDPGEGGFFQKRVGGSGDDTASNGPDPESPEFQAAFEKCKDKLPNSGEGGPGFSRSSEAN